MPVPVARGACLAALVVCLGACSPPLDWRDVRPDGTALKLQFPCRPDRQQRTLKLAGVPVRLSLQACSAGGRTWGLGVADVGDPARVEAALGELRAAAAANVGAPVPALEPLSLPGATPHAGAGRARLQGRAPDGTPVHMELAFFARGTLVFQASALGSSPAADPVQIFFGALGFET